MTSGAQSVSGTNPSRNAGRGAIRFVLDIFVVTLRQCRLPPEVERRVCHALLLAQ
jgi:hypothetical protein